MAVEALVAEVRPETKAGRCRAAGWANCLAELRRAREAVLEAIGMVLERLQKN